MKPYAVMSQAFPPPGRNHANPALAVINLPRHSDNHIAGLPPAAGAM